MVDFRIEGQGPDLSCRANLRSENGHLITLNLQSFYNSPMLGLALAATAAAMSAAGYQFMAATGQWYGKAFTRIRRGSKELALTYDDGPNDPHTLRVLEVLAKHNVKATLFLIGRYVEQRP